MEQIINKLVVVRLVKKFIALRGTQMFVVSAAGTYHQPVESSPHSRILLSWDPL